MNVKLPIKNNFIMNNLSDTLTPQLKFHSNVNRRAEKFHLSGSISFPFVLFAFKLISNHRKELM